MKFLCRQFDEKFCDVRFLNFSNLDFTKFFKPKTLLNFSGIFFFWIGMKYDQYQKCPTTPMMNPDHVANHPELIRAWDSETELKHKETFLLIIVLSSPTNKERRSIIRETWANTHKTVRDNYLMYFILGHQELSAEIAQDLQDEKSQYKDILALPLFDSYQTLTAKVLAAFVQLNRNVKFKYLLKVDDDSYVQLPVLIDELKIPISKKSFIRNILMAVPKY